MSIANGRISLKIREDRTAGPAGATAIYVKTTMTSDSATTRAAS